VLADGSGAPSESTDSPMADAITGTDMLMMMLKAKQKCLYGKPDMRL
jgi:hypothetical protein